MRHPSRYPQRPPKTRAGCSALPRPCPAWACKYSLALIIDGEPTYPPGFSCCLDFCDENEDGATLEAVGAVIATTGRRGRDRTRVRQRLGVTRELVRQIEAAAIAKLRAALPEAELRELLRDVASLETQGFTWPSSLDGAGHGTMFSELHAEMSLRHPDEPHSQQERPPCRAPLPPSLAAMAKRLGR